jgi:hypothetical protein
MRETVTICVLTSVVLITKYGSRSELWAFLEIDNTVVSRVFALGFFALRSLLSIAGEIVKDSVKLGLKATSIDLTTARSGTPPAY